MARGGDPIAERLTLLLLLGTFLFIGSLRAFLSSVYYSNLTDLGLNVTAAWSLLLLAPLLFFVPALARRPHALLWASALGLGLSRVLLPLARGGPLHLPLAGVAAASGLLLLGALLQLARRQDAAALGIGAAVGWALDVALVWYADSADPTASWRGLLLLLPTAAFLVWLSLRPFDAVAPDTPRRTPWVAGAALGAWLFLENTILGNAFGAARWNGHEPAVVAAASIVGLAAGALLLSRAPLPRAALVALHAGAALALLDHAYLHTPIFPLLLAFAQTTMVVDFALLASALAQPKGARALVLTGLVALVLHFVFAFTFLFAYVPLGALWEGRAPALILLAALLLLAPLASAGAVARTQARRPWTLLAVPVLLALVAAATPGAAIVEPTDRDVRVLSFNVHQGFANDGVVDPEAFVAVLTEEDPDIVLLQESDTPRFTSGNLDIATHLAQRLGYHLVYGQPTREQAFGGAILSRYPVLESHVHSLPSESDDRFFTEALLDVAGRPVWVYAVHFTLPREDRLAETDALLAQVATRAGPMILAGDLNSCPTMLCPDEENKGDAPDDVYARMTSRFQDAWVATGRSANDTAAYTYEASAPDQRIDYVFATHDIDVLAADTVKTEAARRASDHLPVRAELHIP